MKKIVIALLVSVFAASVSFAAISSPCGSCKQTCKKPAPCNTCQKPSPCNACQKTPCGCPSNVVQEKYKRNVLGQRVPVDTALEGSAVTDKATRYNESLISGKEEK